MKRFTAISATFCFMLIMLGCAKKDDTTPSNANNTNLPPNVFSVINQDTTYNVFATATMKNGVFNIAGGSGKQQFTMIYDDYKVGTTNFTYNRGVATYINGLPNPTFFSTNFGSQYGGNIEITSIDTVHQWITGSFGFLAANKSNTFGETIKGTFTDVKYTGTIPHLKSQFNASINGTAWTGTNGNLTDDPSGKQLQVLYTAADNSKFYVYLPDTLQPGTYDALTLQNSLIQYIGSTYYGVKSGTVTLTINSASCVQGNFSFMGATNGNSTPVPITGSFTSFY